MPKAEWLGGPYIGGASLIFPNLCWGEGGVRGGGVELGGQRGQFALLSKQRLLGHIAAGVSLGHNPDTVYENYECHQD